MSARRIRNSWWVDFRYGFNRYRKRSPDNSRAGALAFESLLRQKLARGEPLEAPEPIKEPLLRDFVPEWMETYVKSNNKPTEQRTKEVALRLHLLPWFGSMKLSAITSHDIERYKAVKQKEKLAPKTINNHLGTLMKSLRTANEWGMLPVLPRSSLLQVPPQPYDYLSSVESATLLGDTQEPIWHEMLLVALRTGMRLGELLGLDWSAIDFGRRLITVRQSIVSGKVSSPKNNRMRHIPMAEEVVNALQPRSKTRGLVFPRPDGEPHSSYNASTLAIVRHCKRVGLRRIGWHTLRHTFASQLATEGVPMKAISDLLGHSTLQLTMRYAHLAPTTLQSSIELLQAAEQRDMLRFGQQVGNTPKVPALTV